MIKLFIMIISILVMKRHPPQAVPLYLTGHYIILKCSGKVDMPEKI